VRICSTGASFWLMIAASFAVMGCLSVPRTQQQSMVQLSLPRAAADNELVVWLKLPVGVNFDEVSELDV
jgi:hypothetical protein